VVGPVTVGRGCFVGTRSILREGSVMEDGARLEDLSLLPAGARIPKGETWAGSPAGRVSRVKEVVAPAPARRPLRRAATVALYAGLALVLPTVFLVAIAPGMGLLIYIDPARHPWMYLGAAPLVGASFVIFLATEVVVLKWLLLGRVRAGTYPVHGEFYVRKWIIDQLLALSLELVAPLHATLYLAPWFRAAPRRRWCFLRPSRARRVSPGRRALGAASALSAAVLRGAPRTAGGSL